MSYKLTRKEAIDAFCKSCIYDPHGGNGSWLNQVEACTASLCPLYEYRPITLATKDKNKQERYEVMSPEEQLKYREKQEEARIRFKDNLDKGEGL